MRNMFHNVDEKTTIEEIEADENSMEVE